MDPQYLTWSQFYQLVIDRMGVHGVRVGIEAQRRSIIRSGVIELQDLISNYVNGHETLYLPQDFVGEGHASRATKPPQSVIRDAYLCALITADADGNTLPNPFAIRYPLTPADWEDRMGLVNGYGCVNDGTGYIAIDPQGYTFYVFPEVFDNWLVSMFWDGRKLDFKDDEETPFDEPMANAVALYTLATLAREIDNDGEKARDLKNEYNSAKTILNRMKKAERNVQSVGIGGRPYGWLSAQCALRDPCLACSPVERIIQQVYTYPGNPNGHVPPSPAQYTTLPLICVDTVNEVNWIKDNGIADNLGWH